MCAQILLLCNRTIVFQSTRCKKISFFSYKDRINRSQQSRVIYRANCWDLYKWFLQWLHDRKTEHFKALAKNYNTSAIADHIKTTGHNTKWDHFDILAKLKAKSKRPYLFKNLSQLSMSVSVVKSSYFINLLY